MSKIDYTLSAACYMQESQPDPAEWAICLPRPVVNDVEQYGVLVKNVKTGQFAIWANSQTYPVDQEWASQNDNSDRIGTSSIQPIKRSRRDDGQKVCYYEEQLHALDLQAEDGLYSSEELDHMEEAIRNAQRAHCIQFGCTHCPHWENVGEELP